MAILDLEQEAFGVDINDFSIKIVKLKKTRSGFYVESFTEKRIMPGIIEDGVIKNENALAQIIKSSYENVKGKKIKTKYVIASLPEEKSFLQVIQMPKMREDELSLSVPFEAENYIPLPIEEVYLDFQVISPAKDYANHLEVLIVAIPKKIVDSYVSVFKKAGLVPIILESESEATARALIKKEDSASPIVLIDLGENNTDLVIYTGKSVRFTCSIPVSSKDLTDAISSSLKIDWNKAEKLKIENGVCNKKSGKEKQKIWQATQPILEDLVTEVKKYINFYRDHASYEYLLPGGKIGKVLLCGGGSQLKGLTEFMTENLQTQVQLGDPFANFMAKNQKSIINKDVPSFATAIGLALRQINEKSDTFGHL